mmetsp:Transcript_102055/g.317472  ORF Transcript_102055/g.317472 Transcript_102055/m.317472 type:complete len:225 (+) Transcript_102055:570-1244(+)
MPGRRGPGALKSAHLRCLDPRRSTWRRPAGRCAALWHRAVPGRPGNGPPQSGRWRRQSRGQGCNCSVAWNCGRQGSSRTRRLLRRRCAHPASQQLLLAIVETKPLLGLGCLLLPRHCASLAPVRPLLCIVLHLLACRSCLGACNKFPPLHAQNGQLVHDHTSQGVDGLHSCKVLRCCTCCTAARTTLLPRRGIASLLFLLLLPILLNLLIAAAVFVALSDESQR